MGFSMRQGIVAALLMAGEAAALDPIVMKGTKFFYQNGTQFFMKGIAYQQEVGAAGKVTTTEYIDPLSDEATCQRDVPLLQKAGTNTIRTYAIDPTADHSACMKLLQDAGIYVVSDLSEPKNAIIRDSPSWDTTIFKRYTDVIDEMSQYPNVIGFFAGNEVTDQPTNSNASAFVKAAVRDSKAYIKSKNLDRWIGVGYASNDHAKIRADIAYYFNCGDESAAIDFWGYNIYSWCGENTFEGSGYKAQTDFFRNYSVPVFFAEYGCNEGTGGADGRIWEETTALYSDDMTPVFSGGIVYMFHQEENDYGLVEISGNTATPMKNFERLAEKVNAAKPTGVEMDSYTPSNAPQACPALSETWASNSDTLPPTPDSSLCECMYKSATCVPSDDLDVLNYGKLFGEVCGIKGSHCDGISADPKTGKYGAFSMCTPKQKLGAALNAYYAAQKSASDACDFAGMATIKKAETVEQSCTNALGEIEDSGGLASNTSTGLPSSGGGGSSNIGDSAGDRTATWRVGFGNVMVGAYALIAMGVGAGVVLF